MGKAAIGGVGETDQKLLPNAVKIRGAVSPAMRATARSAPVTIPGIAVSSKIVSDVRHFVYPSAKAASRMETGTRRIISSVVRVTSGIIIAARAMPPASADNGL